MLFLPSSPRRGVTTLTQGLSDAENRVASRTLSLRASWCRFRLRRLSELWFIRSFLRGCSAGLRTDPRTDAAQRQCANRTKYVRDNSEYNQRERESVRKAVRHACRRPSLCPAALRAGRHHQWRVHNVVIIATENDSVYAYDADSPAPLYCGKPAWWTRRTAPAPAKRPSTVPPRPAAPIRSRKSGLPVHR